MPPQTHFSTEHCSYIQQIFNGGAEFNSPQINSFLISSPLISFHLSPLFDLTVERGYG